MNNKDRRHSLMARRAFLALMAVFLVGGSVSYLASRSVTVSTGIQPQLGPDAQATTPTPLPTGFIPTPGIVTTPSTVYTSTTPPTETGVYFVRPPATALRSALESTPQAASCGGAAQVALSIDIVSASRGFEVSCYTVKANMPVPVTFVNQAVNSQTQLPLVLTVDVSSEGNPSFGYTTGQFPSDIENPNAAVASTPALLDGTPTVFTVRSLPPGYYYLKIRELSKVGFAVWRVI